MHSNKNLRKTFVRQAGDNDCGIACIAMILNFTGKNQEASRLVKTYSAPPGGLSLLELKQIAGHFNLACRCVEMDMEILKTLESPCILLTSGSGLGLHFQVCFSRKVWNNEVYFLMADPARQFYYLDEASLQQIWISNGALFFEPMRANLRRCEINEYAAFLKMAGIPGTVFFVLPLISFCAAVSGICLTWLLQKGFIYPPLFKNARLITSLICLLSIVSISKTLFSFLKNFTLDKIGMRYGKSLMLKLIDQISPAGAAALDTKCSADTKTCMQLSQTMQRGLSAFLSTVLCESVLLLPMLGFVYFEMPFAGMIDCCLVTALALLTMRYMPRITEDYALLNSIVAMNEAAIFLAGGPAGKGVPQRPDMIRNLNRLEAALGASSNGSGKRFVLSESLGTVTVLLVLLTGTLQLMRDQLEYDTFMIVVLSTFLIASLCPRICNAMVLFSEGADAAAQYGQFVDINA